MVDYQKKHRNIAIKAAKIIANTVQENLNTNIDILLTAPDIVGSGCIKSRETQRKKTSSERSSEAGTLPVR
jgi:uncharacterized protein (UPF0254 family)